MVVFWRPFRVLVTPRSGIPRVHPGHPWLTSWGFWCFNGYVFRVMVTNLNRWPWMCWFFSPGAESGQRKWCHLHQRLPPWPAIRFPTVWYTERRYSWRIHPFRTCKIVSKGPHFLEANLGHLEGETTPFLGNCFCHVYEPLSELGWSSK